MVRLGQKALVLVILLSACGGTSGDDPETEAGASTGGADAGTTGESVGARDATGGVPAGDTGGVMTGGTGGVTTGGTGGVMTGGTGGVMTGGTGGVAAGGGPAGGAGGGICHYEGQELGVGESAWDSQSCNICTCEASGDVVCTDDACTCDARYSECMREYMSDDPTDCATLTFDCPEHTTRFDNDCGCGCHQSPDCPTECLCVWGTTSMPDCSRCNAIQRECPYIAIMA